MALCDGYIKNLLADSTVVDVANTTVNSGNVLAQLALIFAAAPAAIIRKKADLRLYVSVIWLHCNEGILPIGNLPKGNLDPNCNGTTKIVKTC